MCLSPLPALAADWNGYASIASDYVYRGVSLLESGPTVQGGVEGRFDERYVVGAWAAKIDRQWLYQQSAPDHVELDLYAGFDIPCGAHCRARLLASRYVFPGPGTRDWTEASLSVAFADRVGATFSYSPQGLGTNWISRTTEAWLQHPLSRSTSVELGYGLVTTGRFDYWFARAGVSRRIDRYVIDLSAYASDPDLRRFGLDDRSRRLVLSISTAF